MPEASQTFVELIEKRILELRAERRTLDTQLRESRNKAACAESGLTRVQKQIDRLVYFYTYERAEQESK